MSKVYRKSLIAVFAVLLAITSVFGFATLPTFNPTAQEEAGFYVVDGASIRIEDDGYIGIKYTTVVNQQWYRDTIKDYQNAKVSFGSLVAISDTKTDVESITSAVAVDSNYNEVKDICHVSNDSSDKTTSQVIGFKEGVMTYSTTIIFNIGKVYTELKDANNGVNPTAAELKAEMLKRFYKKIIVPRSYIKIEVQGSEPVYQYAQAGDNVRSVLVIADNYLDMFNNNASSINLPKNYADNFFGTITEYENAGVGDDRIIKGYNFNANNSSYAAYGAILELEDSDKSAVKLPEEKLAGVENGGVFKLTVFNANGDVDRLTIKRGDVAIATSQELKDHIQIDEDYDGTLYYVLANNIDMAGVEFKHTHTSGYYTTSNDNWNEYKYGDEQIVKNIGFKGTFDGNGNTIYNLDVTTASTGVNPDGEFKSAGMKIGLFGIVYGGTIKNLALYNLYSTEAVYMACFSDGNSKYENIYVKVSDDTYAPKGFYYCSAYGTAATFNNIIIQYDVALTGNGKYSAAAIGKKYGVWNGRMTAISDKSSNIYVISPSAITMTGSGDDVSAFSSHRYATNEVYINTHLRKPVYDKEDPTKIIGAEQIRVSEANTILKKENSVGFWDEENKEFTFVNTITSTNIGYINNKVTTFKRFDNLEQFMADEDVKDLGEYWDLVNGVPVWKNLSAEANGQIFIKDVALTNGTNVQVNEFTIDTENEKYQVSIEDNFGFDIGEFVLETSEPNFLKVDGKNLYVENIRQMPSKIYVTIIATVYDREVTKEFVVNVNHPISYEYANNEYLYSEADKELRISDLGFETISKVWYKDANGNLNELVYNAQNNTLDGIKTSTVFTGSSYRSAFNGLNVDFTFADETTATIKLGAKNGALAESISLLLFADGQLYQFNNVKPVYKAIDEESELDMTLYYNPEKDYQHNASTLVYQVQKKYLMLGSSLTASGEYYGYQGKEITWYLINTVIDGNGHYLKDYTVKNVADVTQTRYGIFGGNFNQSSMANLAFYNLRVTKSSALFSYTYGSSFNNVFIDISDKSTNYYGLSNSTWYARGTQFRNVLINCPVSEENGSYVINGSTSLDALGHTYGDYDTNLYMISKLPMTKVKITVEGVDEAARTYKYDTFNQKPQDATKHTVVSTDANLLKDVYLNANKDTVYHERLAAKRYNSFVEFKNAEGNDYRGFTNENGSGCWTLQSGVPIWKDYYEVMSEQGTIFTFTEGDNVYENDFTITNMEAEYQIGATLLGSPVEITNIESNTSAIAVDLENLTIKASTIPSELIYGELTFTYNVYGNTITRVVKVNIGYPETQIADTYLYSEVDGEIMGIENVIGSKEIKAAYYIDEEGAKVKLPMNDGKIKGISVITEQRAKTNPHYQGYVTKYVGTVSGETESREFVLTPNAVAIGNTLTNGIKLYVFCEGECYILNNVIPTTKVIDNYDELDLNYDSNPDEDYNQGYVVLGSNIDGTEDLTGRPEPTAVLSKEFVFDGRGYTIKNIKLAEGNTKGIFAATASANYYGSHTVMFGSIFTNFALVDVKADNSVLIANSISHTLFSNAYIRVSNQTNNYQGLSNSSISYNGTRYHMLAVYYEYIPVYTEENIGELDASLIGTERPYADTEWFVTTGTVSVDAFSAYQTHANVTFVGNGKAARLNFDQNFNGNVVDIFNKLTDEDKKYAFAKGYFNKPIKWANSKLVTDLQAAKIANGTMWELPEGVESMAGQPIPEIFYTTTSAVSGYDIATANYPAAFAVDLTLTTKDEIVALSKNITNGYKYFAIDTDATFYAHVAYLNTYKSVADAKTNNSDKAYNTAWWNKVEGGLYTWKTM